MDDPFPPNMLQDIKSVLSNDSYRAYGLDVYQDVFDSPTMFPLQRQRELARMIQISRSIAPECVMEIGSDKGGGLYHWCKSISSVKNVIGCEIRGTPYNTLFENAFPHLSFFWLPMSSYEPGAVHATQKFLSQGNGLGRPTTHGSYEKIGVIDILFIDGDKSYFDKDFDVYLPLMNPKGIVFMHDIQDKSPRASYEKIIKRGYRHEEIIDKRDWEESEQRRMDGIAPKSEHESWLRHWEGKSCGVGVIYLDSPEAKLDSYRYQRDV